MRSVARRVAVISVLVVAAVLLLAVPSLLSARSASIRGARWLDEAERRLSVLDISGGRAALASADVNFDRGAHQLRTAWVVPAHLLPGVRRNVDVARRLAVAGRRLVRAGDTAAAALDRLPENGVTKGRIDLEALRLLGTHIPAIDAVARSAAIEIAQTPRSFLLAPVGHARRDAMARVRAERAKLRATKSAVATALRLLGAGTPRRYLVLMANLAELRGTGGLFGYFAVIGLDHGRLRLESGGRPDDVLPPPGRSHPKIPRWFANAYGRYATLAGWGNLNLTSDFPTVARIALNTLPARFGEIDGVVQIDPLALQALLQMIGPVVVKSWPGSIDASNVSRITHHDSYVKLPLGQRVSFLGDLVDGVVARLGRGQVPAATQTFNRLAAAVSGGHVRAYVRDGADQAVLVRAGLGGEVPEAMDDALGIVANDSSGTKIDWYLRRHLAYRVRPDPARGDAATKVDIALSNRAPASGQPAYVIGPMTTGVARGTNRLILVTLRSARDDIVAATLNGRRIRPSSDHEQTLKAYHEIVTIPPGATAHATLQSIVRIAGSGRQRTYRLALLHQPTAWPDSYDVRVDVPRGWRASTPTRFSGRLSSDVTLRVCFRQTLRAWIFERAILGPFRLARDLVARVL